MPSLKDQIIGLAKVDLRPINFGGIECFIKRWNEREQIEWAVECQASKTDDKPTDLWVRCKAIARSLCDENGKLIFEPTEFEQLAELDSDVIDPAWDAVIALQSREDESKKNSEAQPLNSV